MSRPTATVAGAVTGAFFAGMAAGAALLVGSFVLFGLAAVSAAVGAFVVADAIRIDVEFARLEARQTALQARIARRRGKR